MYAQKNQVYQVNSLDLPDIARRALEPGEKVIWIGKPARFPRLSNLPKMVRWFVYVFFGIWAFAFMLGVVIPLAMGEPVMVNNEPLNFKKDGPIILFSMAVIGSFWLLFRWNYGKYRYIVTDRRAFHYRPIWGGSWSWTRNEGWARDYNDPETSPISGGYFTRDTSVSRSGSATYGMIEIGPLSSTMDDARTISVIKSAVPALDNLIYDPSNLDFAEVKNPKQAEIEIGAALKVFRRKLNARTQECK